MRSFMNRAGYSQPCLIVFHGVIDASPEERDQIGGWCQGCKYIQEFCAFIRLHKLGEVVEGAKAENVSNHPGHIIQAVTWAPDYPAINAWAAAAGAAAAKKSITL